MFQQNPSVLNWGC